MSATNLKVKLHPPNKAFRGLPGTGKTTTLLEVMAHELNNGVPLDEIAVSTYRRLMADEFVERADEEVRQDVEGTDHKFRTTHSLCYRLLELDPDRVCDDPKRDEFCEEYGVGFNPYIVQAGSDEKNPLGNELFAAIDYSRNTLRDPIEGYRECPTLSPNARQAIGRSDGTLIEDFYEKYERWKADNHLVDFTDMLAQVAEQGLSLGVTVLIEDEFQDKSPLQLKVYNEWAKAADRVYVAGDRNQAIYGFQGTKPEYMEQAFGRARSTSTLDTSYRFGPDCWAYATTILHRAGYDVPDIDPVGETDVKSLSWADYPRVASSVSSDPAFHLVRANYQKGDVADALDNAGIVFSATGNYGWDREMVDTYNAVSGFRSLLQSWTITGGSISFDNWNQNEKTSLIEALPGGALTARRPQILDEVEKSSKANPGRFIDKEAAMRAFGDDNPFLGVRREAFDSAHQQQLLADAWTDRDGERIGAIDHHLTTIHGSKGRERKHVFLHDLSTPNSGQATDSPDEARTFFVGATRAEEHLWVVRHGSMNTAGLPAV